MSDVPTTFGKYYLTEKLATGGMAEIYLAKLIGPSGFEKLLVIKQIMPQWSGDPQFVDLFVTEAKTLVGLTHGNIVPIYELGVVDQIYFIAMEYIDGITIEQLATTLRQQALPMPALLAAWIMARVLDGLDYAHRKGQGVLHRDISPRNIMLSRDGEVKLLDFGIALPLDAAAQGNVVLAGSFPYMSPEQARGQALSGQSDIFSVGVVLWELLTGTSLFRCADSKATLEAVMHGPIADPTQLRADIPPAIEAAVMRALARSLDTRWGSAGELAAELSRVVYQQATPPNARDVADLVARYAPALQAPTQPNDATTPTEGRSDGTTPIARPRPIPSAPLLPHTTPVPRPRRAATHQESFATAVGFDALLDEPATPFSTSPPPALSAPAVQSGEVHAPAPTTTAPAVPTALAPANRSRRPIVALLASVGVALGGLAVWRFTRTAATVPPVAALDAHIDSPLDAPHETPARVDAAIAPPRDAPPAPIDARPTPAPHDARVVAPRTLDAPRVVTVQRDAAPSSTGSNTPREQATLRVGAVPWGEVYIDGVAVGRTPLERRVAAGEHQIEIRFPVGSPPRSETYRVQLVAGETKRLLADFAAAAGSASGDR